MRKTRQIVFQACVLSAIMLMVACNVDLLTPDERPIRLSASGEAVTTRAGAAIQGSTFLGGQEINVYITADDEAATPIGNPTVCTTDAPKDGVNALRPDVQPYYPSGLGSGVRIYALYPREKTTRELTTGDAMTFTVEKDQTSDKNYMLSDLMWCKPFKQTKTSETVHLGFRHLMAKLVITAAPETDEEAEPLYEITGITLNGIHRSVDFTPSTGQLGSLDTETSLANTSIDMANGGAVLFPPQSVTHGNFIHVHTRRLADGKEEDAVFGINDKEFVSGHEYLLNVAVGSDNIGQNDYTINGWDEDDGEVTVAPNGGEDGMTAQDIGDSIYTGKPIRPQPKVYFGTTSKKLLSLQNGDYTLDYVDNTDVGMGQVLIMGQGFYAGLIIVKSFNIVQAQGSIAYPKTAYGNVAYSIGGTITDNDLVQVGDGRVTYSSNKPAIASVDAESGIVTINSVGDGVTITATVEDSRNWHYATKTAQYTLNVTGRNASNFRVTLSDATFTDASRYAYTYDNTAHQPTVTVYDVDSDTPLNENSYTVTFPTDKTNAGTKTITVTGKGNYSSSTSKTADYIIDKATPTITIDQTSWVIGRTTGHKKRDKTRVGTTNSWVAASDWQFTPSNGTNEGTATVTNTGGSATISGTKAGNLTLTVSIKQSTNYNAKSVTIPVQVLESEWDYAYNGTTNAQDCGNTGSVRKWTCPADGTYVLQVWGAQGGSTPTNINNAVSGGRGAYVGARIELKANDVLYISVGGKGGILKPSQVSEGNLGGWNGGGTSRTGTEKGATAYDGGGGGATDFAIYGTEGNTSWNTTAHLYSRILVAGGGGGCVWYQGTSHAESGYNNGGAGGAWIGEAGDWDDWGYGGQLSAGGERGHRHSSVITQDGSFGKGADTFVGGEGDGAGGGGWYGGAGGGLGSGNASGGGGSSYMWSSALSGEKADPYDGQYDTGFWKTKGVDADGNPITRGSGGYTFNIGSQANALYTYYPTTQPTYKPATRYYMTLIKKTAGDNTGHGKAKITRENFGGTTFTIGVNDLGY